MKDLFRRLFSKNRRQFKRFVVKEVVPVFIGRGVPTDARLMDISIGGIALEYAPGQEAVGKTFALDIQASDGFQLGKVLLQKISDKKIKNPEGNFTHLLRGQFLNLSQVKANKLERFLQGYQEKLGKSTG